ncbi:MAG: metallophosphoesterase [bacterium]
MKKQTKKNIENVIKIFVILFILSINKMAFTDNNPIDNNLANNNPVIIGPYLQPTEDLEHSMVVSWITEKNYEAKIKYRIKGQNSFLEKIPQKEIMYVMTFSNLKSPGKYEYYIKGTENELKGEFEIPSSFPSPKAYREIWWMSSILNEKLIGFYKEKGTSDWKETNDLKIRIKHTAKLTNLQSGQIYEYTVDDKIYSFKTSTLGQEFKIALIADPHVGGYPHTENFEIKNNEKVVKHIIENGMPEITIFLGDLVHGRNVIGTSFVEYENFFIRFKDLLTSSICIATFGNHDYDLTDNYSYTLWRMWFTFPNNGPKELEDLVYSIKYGNVYFINLLYQKRDQQINWVEQELKKAKNLNYDFIFTLEHVPSYSIVENPYRQVFELGNQNSWYKDKEKWLKLYNDYGVDIEFSGHEHLLQRTVPITTHPENCHYTGLLETAELHSYFANTEGVIYANLPITWKPSNYVSNYIYNPIISKNAGYGEVIIRNNGKICNFKCYSLENLNQSLIIKTNDYFTIDKTQNSSKKNLSKEKIVINKIQANVISGYKALIQWNTNLESKGSIEYWEKNNKERNFMPLGVNEIFEKEHQIMLQLLTPETDYCYQITNIREKEKSISEIQTFKTYKAKEEEIYAQFDFGPSAFLPEKDYARVYLYPYKKEYKYGWVNPFDENGNLIIHCGINEKKTRIIFTYFLL